MERYEKICQIGNGAFSKVYKCRVRDSGNLVAIKMLLEEDEEDPRLKQLAMREIRLLNVSPIGFLSYLAYDVPIGTAWNKVIQNETTPS